MSKQTKLVHIPVEKLYPHENNPRKDLGDLTELAESIKANGVLQNLTVVPNDPANKDTDFKVVIGHRRLAAAKLAGLATLPCVSMEMTEKEQIQTMLLENMQRSDLTVYEQAQGFQMMLDMGDTVDEIAAKSGFSTTTVRRRVKMMELDQTVLKEVSARQLSLSDFDKLAQIEDISERNRCLSEIGTHDFNSSVERQLRRQTIQNRLPAVTQQLKSAHAKKLKQNDTWSGKYASVDPYVNIVEWDGESALVPEGVKDMLYYYLDEVVGKLRFYTERKKAAPVKRSAAEIEIQKRLDAAWAKADESAAVAHCLRREFVSGISLNSKNQTALLKGAISSVALRCITYGSVSSKDVFSALKIEDPGYGSDRNEKVMTAIANVSAKGYPALIYANFCDSDKQDYVTGWKKEWPKHEKNMLLDALYSWLCALGYEMSEEEKALQSGTHELFKDPAKGQETGE